MAAFTKKHPQHKGGPSYPHSLFDGAQERFHISYLHLRHKQPLSYPTFNKQRACPLHKEGERGASIIKEIPHKLYDYVFSCCRYRLMHEKEVCYLRDYDLVLPP